MIALWLSSAALAVPDAHYHPDHVASASTLFAQVSEASAPVFEDRQGTAAVRAAGLRAWSLGLDLLGDRAPAPEREALAASRKAFFRDQAVISAFASDVMTDVDTAFSEALTRALDAEGGAAWPVCRETASRGLRMQPRLGAAPPPTDCPGDDRSEALAARIDADPLLQRAIASLTTADWPAFSPLPGPGEATPGTGALDVVDALRRHAKDALAAIEAADDAARLPIDAALEQDLSGDARDALRAQVAKIEATTRARYGSLASPVLAAVDAVAARLAKRGGPTPAWCARPASYGGCDTPTMAANAEEALWTHSSVRKALALAARWRPAP